MAPLRWALLLFCLGTWLDSSQSSTCSHHVQCRYDYATAKADCSSLHLDCIPVNYPDARIMDLSHNNISELSSDDFRGAFSRLAELYLDYNTISDLTSLLGSNELRNLQKLSVKHNVISVLPTTCQLSSLIALFVDYNSITRLRVPQCGGLRQLSADFNSIRSTSERLSFGGQISPILNISLQFNGIKGGFYIRVNSHYENLNLSLYLDHNVITSLHIHSSVKVFNKISFRHNKMLSYSVHSIPDEIDAASNAFTRLSSFGFSSVFPNFLKKIDVSNNSLQSLIQPFSAGKVELLNADTNLLANLSSTTLSGFLNLTEFHVANNSLLFISPTALGNLSKLQSLYLDDNALTSLFGGVFSNQSNLVELSITNNRLAMLHPDYFMGLVSLERLYLAGNQLTSVNSQMFRLMPQVLTLDVSRNELQVVDLQDCALNSNLHNLSLAHNKIHDTVTVFGYCNNLGILDLSHNLIQVVPGDSLSGRNKALSNLELEGNPLQCDCRLTGLRDWLRNTPSHVEPRCEGPKQHHGSVIADLNITDFSCKQPTAMTARTNLTVVAGENAVLACTASGIPAPTITWINPDGTKISHEWQGRFAILQGRILHITPVLKSDQGVYTCLARNALGEMDDAVVNVTVSTSPPTPPNALSVSTSPPTPPNALSVGWTDVAAVLIAIAVTLSVVAFVILFRRRCKKFKKGTDTKVVYRATDEEDGAPTDTLAVRNRYVAVTTPATKNPSYQIDADVYEEPSASKRDRTEYGDVYENVPVRY